MAGGEQRVCRSVELLIVRRKVSGSNDVPVVIGVRSVGVNVAVDLGLVRGFGEDRTTILRRVDFGAK